VVRPVTAEEAPEFDFEGLAAALKDGESELYLVMIESADGSTYQTYHLDLDRKRVQAPFRKNLAESINQYETQAGKKGRLELYEPGWAPQEGEMAVAGLHEIESRLVPSVRDGLGRLGPLRPAPPRAAPSTDELEPVRGYAAVLRAAGGEALLFRRRDPVERLGKGRLTTVLRESRLERIDHVVAFDSGVDVALWGNKVLIRSLGAFEALFYPRAERERIAKEFIEKLEKRLPIGNAEGLRDAARDDMVFASRLRRLARSRVMSETDPEMLAAEMRRATVDFGLAIRFLADDGALVFPSEPAWRWAFLALLEDGLVRSAGSNLPYQSESKRVWDRRRVTGATRSEGRIAALCGEGWGPLLVQDVEQRLRRARTTFYVATGAGDAEVLPGLVSEGLRTMGPGGATALETLPECDVQHPEGA
jgi:Domain of unknown function (DUF4868)